MTKIELPFSHLLSPDSLSQTTATDLQGGFHAAIHPLCVKHLFYSESCFHQAPAPATGLSGGICPCTRAARGMRRLMTTTACLLQMFQSTLDSCNNIQTQGQ